MDGRVCVITGASSGIGRATARELGRQADVRRIAAELLARYSGIHVLINNAAVVNTSRRTTPDGIEANLAVNHLAYFLLTDLLRERIVESAPARIVNVASEGHRFARLDLDDLEWSQRPYGSGMAAYGTSKLLNVLFSYELARRLEGTGVTVNCLHPGGVNTGLGDNNGRWQAAFGKLIKAFMRSPESGARTSIFLASAPEVAELSGRYWKRCREARSSELSYDEDLARSVWEISERLTAARA